MAIEFNIFDNIPSGESAWTKRYWEQKNSQNDKVTKWLRNSNQAMVEEVLKNDKTPQERVHDFYDSQRELAQDLPAQCKEGGKMEGATVEISEMQLRNQDEFSDRAFVPQSKANIPKWVRGNKIYHIRCGHYTDLKHLPSEDRDIKGNDGMVKDDYCFACKITVGSEFNPKPDFVSFLKKENEMSSCPSEAYNQLTKDNFNDPNTVFPNPFGSAGSPIWNPNMKPTSSLPEGTLASNPSKEALQDMQKDNTIDYIGNRYLPKSTQDGKKDSYLPPEFQLSSANADLGYLMAMIPNDSASKFINFAKQNIDPDTLTDKEFEQEPHITVCYGFSDGFDCDKLDKIIGGTGSISFSLGPVSRFECENYDVLYFQVNSPELEILNAKVSREFADQIEETNHRYIPHLTLAYVKNGSNLHLDGKEFKKKSFGVNNLVYCAPNQTKKQIVSLAWDTQHYTDLDFQDGIGKKQSQEEKPLNSVGDALQDFLNKRSADKKADNDALLGQLKKPFGHNKV